jgi:hypothetical protein
MEKAFLLIAFVIGIVCLVYKFGYADPKAKRNSQVRPINPNENQEEKENDKIIIVKRISLEYLNQAIKQFCESYNENRIIAKPRLIITENQYIIIFPYDIDFEHFCYFINYLKYANELGLKPDYKPEILAWCSTHKGDSWMTDQIINKHVMVYIPEWDKEYDNVYLTTEYNLGFKMGFAMGHSHIKLDKPIIDYQNPPSDFTKTEGTQIIDFQ